MQIIVKGKHIDVGESLREHVEKSIHTLTEKYFTDAIEVNVVFGPQAHLYKADISMHLRKRILLQSSAESTDIYHAFDAAADRMRKQLQRYKEKLKDHHSRLDVINLEEARKFVLESEHDDKPAKAEPVVVAEMTANIETLTVAEAVMRLDLGNIPALLFRNAAHDELNMIYRRADGNIGWVDPHVKVKQLKAV
ncbi:MAG: ribosome hibernation-promoting factor, HPF/YfiA family [Alphaproteobacteria bacterium]